MSSPFTDLNTAIHNKLIGSTALVTALGGTAIYYIQAPEGQATPFVVWSYQSSGAENINPSSLHSSLIFIRCYDTNPARAGTVDGLIDAAINGQTLTVSGWTNYWTAREEDFVIIENPPSQAPIYAVGAFYRINMDK